MSGITVKKVIKYSVMPEIFPRMRRLFTSGFSYVIFLMAQIYAMVRLIPANHPYLLEENIGRFGFKDVVATAANNLVIEKKNIDQIIVFGLMLSAIVLLLLQIVILIGSLIFGGVAMAGGGGGIVVSELFVTANPEHDIAYMLMDRVFGIPDMFGSCISVGVACVDSAGNNYDTGAFPWSFHAALQQFFRFYSTAMLIIGTIIVCYYIVVIVAETATTGTPFGKRFQNVWVPVRLIVAVGMLIPLQYGYNAGQYIAFHAAKYGSSMATYSWRSFNDAVGSSLGDGANPLGEAENLLGKPQTPDVSGIVEALSIAHTCAYSNWFNDYSAIGIANKNAVGANVLGNRAAYLQRSKIKPYLTKTPEAWMGGGNEPGVMLLDAGTTYNQAKNFFYGGDIVITFGRVVDEKEGTAVNDLYASDIIPECGKVAVFITDPADSGGGNIYSGSADIQDFYYNTITNGWFGDENIDYINFAQHMVQENSTAGDVCALPAGGGLRDCADGAGTTIQVQWRQERITDLTVELETAISDIWDVYRTETEPFAITDEVLNRGWGGAGIWFNSVASINGKWMSSVANLPVIISMPQVLEEIRNARSSRSKQVNGYQAYNPETMPGDADDFAATLNSIISDYTTAPTILYKTLVYWRAGKKNFNDNGRDSNMGPILTAIHLIFGTGGLFSMRSDDNLTVHPLAQLASLGRSLVDASIRNIAISSGSAALGGLMSAFPGAISERAQAVGSMAASISYIALTAGLILYYVLPFMPFLYFFFAVASWIKTIFEAMVGVPLWALAHLRIDGDGLPGDSAQNGYFLILEIFLRPILTVAGLLAAMVIFTAQVRILSLVWGLVVQNSGGFDMGGMATGAASVDVGFLRNMIDQFFFTISYTIVVYMMATASFKLIDTIPDNILRWAGSNASSFGDINHDPTGELTRYAALGGMTVIREASEGVTKFSGGIAGSAGRFLGGGR
ncbi:MAG: DotA/TraY family protein [Micavibrio sp.]|nr:DotA/TraY family protein [Micavibrio sp.]